MVFNWSHRRFVQVGLVDFVECDARLDRVREVGGVKAFASKGRFGLHLDVGRVFLAPDVAWDGFLFGVDIHLEVELGLGLGGAGDPRELLLRRVVALGGHSQTLLSEGG